MTITDRQIIDNLAKALVQATAERDAEIESVRVRHQERIDSIERAIAAFNGSFNGNGNLPTDDRRPDMTSLSVGDDKLDIVRQYLRQYRRCRQAEIGTATGLNSGSVSVALRRLHLEGFARPDGKENGSQVWEQIPVAARAAQRE